MSSKVITWTVVGVLAALFVYWQYSNYAHNSQLNSNLGNPVSVPARVDAASELIDKKQFGDVLPTTPEYVHYRVIDALAQIAADKTHKDRATEALNQLVALMKDSDVGVRAKAEGALVRLGPTAISGVIPALKDGDPHAKKGAIDVLDRIGPRSIKDLVNAVTTDKDERPAAIDALVALAPAPSAAMMKLLGDQKDTAVQSAAATYFGDSKQQSAENTLRVLLKTPGVRSAAIRAEGLLRDMRSLPEIEKALTAPADVVNRRTAIVALGNMNAVSSVPMLIPFLQNDDPDIVAVDEVSLGSMGATIVPVLAGSFATGSPAIRQGIAGSLGGETSPQALSLLTEALHDPDSGVRRQAAASLATPNNSAAVAPLILALRDPSPEVATEAENSLVRIGEPSIGPLVVALGTAGGESLTTTPATQPQSAFMDGHVMLAGSPKSAPSAMPSIVVPYYASGALAQIGRPAADKVLAAAQSGSVSSRKWALVTLRDLRVPQAVAVLADIARTGDPALRWYAQDDLRRYQA